MYQPLLKSNPKIFHKIHHTESFMIQCKAITHNQMSSRKQNKLWIKCKSSSVGNRPALHLRPLTEQETSSRAAEHQSSQCWCISEKGRGQHQHSFARSQCYTDCDPECSAPQDQAAGSGHSVLCVGHGAHGWLISHWSPIPEPHGCSYGVCIAHQTD